MTTWLNAATVLASLLNGPQLEIPTLDGPPVTIEKNLQHIDVVDPPQHLCRELNKIVQANPSSPVAIVRCTVTNANKQATGYKLIYSSQHRLMMLMIRTTHEKEKTFYHLRVYDQLDPDQFTERLPVRGHKFWPLTRQSYDKSSVPVPRLFRDSADVHAWP